MPLTHVTGDLFTLGLPAIGHGCNCVGAMGAGIAVQFRRRWPEMYRQYRRVCLGEFGPGDIFVFEAPGVVVFNLATQPTPGPTATLAAIDTSVRAAPVDAEQRGLDQLGIPRIGAGLGGLHWPNVAEVLERAAAGSAVELVVVTLPDA